jgi:curved DNA-binding protein CbpA
MFNIKVGDGHKGTSMDTLYDVLGVSSRANETAIRTAFRKAAKSYHPDLNADNPTAELQFRQLVAAYELLKDPLQRDAYDQQLKDDRRARARRIASPLISGVVSGGIVALTMWWFNTQKPPEPTQAPRVAVADVNEPAGQQVAAVTTTAAATVGPSTAAPSTAARQDDGNPGDAPNSPSTDQHFPADQPLEFAGASQSAPPSSAPSALAGEWERLRATGDAMAIWEFALRNPNAPEAELAQSKLLTLLDTSHNAFLLQMLSIGAPGPIAERARQRITSLGISTEASPDPSVPLEDRAAKFIAAQVTAWSTTNTNNLSTLIKTYADEVYYNGSLKARATVVRDKRRLLERSPERVYGVQPGSIKAECASNLCRVSGILEFQTRGAARSSGASAAAANGATQFEYGTIFSRGTFTIMSESNSAVKASVSQEASHQRPSAQEPSAQEPSAQELSGQELLKPDSAVQALPSRESSGPESPANE